MRSPSLEMAIVRCEKIADSLNSLFGNPDLSVPPSAINQRSLAALQQFALAPSKIGQSRVSRDE
jgi:hypothetical protein